MSEYTDTLDLNKLEEPAYVWIGKEMPVLLLASDADRDEGSTSMLVALNRAHDIPVSFKPVIEFLKYPREASEVKSWIRKMGDDDGSFLSWLVDEKAVIRISPGKGLMDSFNGIHLENNGMLLPVEGQEETINPQPGLTLFSNDNAQSDVDLTPVLRDLLFNHHDDDLNVAVQGASKTLGMPAETVTSELFSRLPTLMRDDFAFLLYME